MIPRGNRFQRTERPGIEGRESGLSGNPDIPDPPSDAPTDLRGRLARAREAVRALVSTLPRVLGLVWSASRILTFGLAFATIVAGVVPAITAYVAKLLIDAVVRAISANVRIRRYPPPSRSARSRSMPSGYVVLLAIAQFLIYALSSFLSTLRNVCQQLLQERVTNSIQLEIMDHAARLDLSFFEDSTSYDLLRRAQQGAASRPLFMVSGVFGLIQTRDRLRVDDRPADRALARSSRSSPSIAPIPAFVADTRYGWRGYSFARWASPLRRRMDYLTTLVTTDTYAKEVKLFGLGPYFIDRFRQRLERLPGSPARTRRHALLRGLRLEHDHDPGRLADLPVRRSPGDRGPADPRRPDAVHPGGVVGPGLRPGAARRGRLDVREQPLPERPVRAPRDPGRDRGRRRGDGTAATARRGDGGRRTAPRASRPRPADDPAASSSSTT